MYDYLKGLPTDKKRTAKGTFVTIEVAGIGYLLEVSERDFDKTSLSDSTPLKYYLSLINIEYSMAFYGFKNK